MVLLISILMTLSLMQQPDSVQVKTKPIPDYLPAELFIPPIRLVGLHPWTSAPLPRPVVEVIKVNGFDGSVGFGELLVVMVMGVPLTYLLMTRYKRVIAKLS